MSECPNEGKGEASRLYIILEFWTFLQHMIVKYPEFASNIFLVFTSSITYLLIRKHN